MNVTDPEFVPAAVEAFCNAYQIEGIVLVTDASFYKKKGGWAFVAYHRGRTAERSGFIQTHSSAHAELVAASKALEFVITKGATTKDPVWVVSDSLYVQGAIRSGRTWLENRQTVPNSDQLRRIIRLVDAHEQGGRAVHCLHVKGHSGVVVNEYVDTLAGRARIKGPCISPCK